MHGNGLPLELKIKNNYIKGNHYQLNQNNTRNKLITDSIHKIKTKTKQEQLHIIKAPTEKKLMSTCCGIDQILKANIEYVIES